MSNTTLIIELLDIRGAELIIPRPLAGNIYTSFKITLNNQVFLIPITSENGVAITTSYIDIVNKINEYIAATPALCK
jgi:hypothetical protein